MRHSTAPLFTIGSWSMIFYLPLGNSTSCFTGVLNIVCGISQPANPRRPFSIFAQHRMVSIAEAYKIRKLSHNKEPARYIAGDCQAWSFWNTDLDVSERFEQLNSTHMCQIWTTIGAKHRCMPLANLIRFLTLPINPRRRHLMAKLRCSIRLLLLISRLLLVSRFRN